MIIMGIDPGINATGWGVIEVQSAGSKRVASGTLRIPSQLSLEQRLAYLHRQLTEVIDCYHPEQCAIEDVFLSRNVKSLSILSHARGVAMCAVGQAGIALQDYTARQIKQCITGSGSASKQQLASMVCILLGITKGLGLDESDALATALTHGSLFNSPLKTV